MTSQTETEATARLVRTRSTHSAPLQAHARTRAGRRWSRVVNGPETDDGSFCRTQSRSGRTEPPGVGATADHPFRLYRSDHSRDFGVFSLPGKWKIHREAKAGNR